MNCYMKFDLVPKQSAKASDFCGANSMDNRNCVETAILPVKDGSYRVNVIY